MILIKKSSCLLVHTLVFCGMYVFFCICVPHRPRMIYSFSLFPLSLSSFFFSLPTLKALKFSQLEILECEEKISCVCVKVGEGA